MKTRVIVAACLLLVVSVDVASQQTRSTLAGRVIGPDGAAVAEAPVRAVSDAMGTDARVVSASDGAWEIRDLPEGTYTVSVTMPCCAFAPYSNPEVVVAGRTRVLEIELQEGGSLNVLGDDPGTINAEIRSRQDVPDRPAPRLDDGTPDLSGFWLIRDDPFPEAASVTAWAQEVADQRIATNFGEHPHTRCLPSEPTTPGGSTPFVSKIVQQPELIVILFEDVPGYRQVFLDSREHPEFPNPSWMGHSVGRWEGDTLVVDTVGFNGRVWVDAYPSTESLHMVERFTRTGYGHMDVRVTVDDPEVFTAPWTRNLLLDLAPDEELIEYVCENNKWAR
jgi:hypothetical protein